MVEDRLERLHGAFERAIAQYGYGGHYQGVFPVKCNQQRHVVEQLVESGRRWHFGLEAGSKAAKIIKHNIAQNKAIIKLPRIYYYAVKLLDHLPLKWGDFILSLSKVDVPEPR